MSWHRKTTLLFISYPPYSWQVIIWIDYGSIYWRIHSSPDLNELLWICTRVSSMCSQFFYTDIVILFCFNISEIQMLQKFFWGAIKFFKVSRKYYTHAGWLAKLSRKANRVRWAECCTKASKLTITNMYMWTLLSLSEIANKCLVQPVYSPAFYKLENGDNRFICLTSISSNAYANKRIPTWTHIVLLARMITA